jgi:hypothetical protein
VFYRAGDQHIHELYWSTGAVGHSDLTALAHAPAAAGDPVGYFFEAQTQNNVFYRGTDGHLHRLFWQLGGVSHQDWTLASGAPALRGDPVAFLTPTGQHTVFYRGVDGHVHGLYSTNGTSVSSDDDLSNAASGAPLPYGDPTAYWTSLDNMYHVLYWGWDGHVHELAWTTGEVRHTDLTTVVPNSAPLPAGKPSAYVVAGDRTQHVIYRATDNTVHDLTWSTPMQIVDRFPGGGLVPLPPRR